MRKDSNISRMMEFAKLMRMASTKGLYIEIGLFTVSGNDFVLGLD